MASYVLEVNELKKHFPVGKRVLKAIDGISFRLEKGKSLGIVGESGSGKSTLARLILGLIEPTAGTVTLFGRANAIRSKKEGRELRKTVQIVFQNPYLSLFPHMTVGANIEEPLRLHQIGTKHERKAAALALLRQVGVPEAYYYAFPHELSGGQQQRVAIARALALNPQMIIFDEPVSSLDVSIQAQILNLLLDLKKDRNLTYLFIAHDLAVVEYVSDLIAVMYMGTFVEYAPTDTVIERALHPYTETLLKSVPVIGGKLQDEVTAGEIPSPLDPPQGCSFHPRCPHQMDICRAVKPALKEVKPNHLVACHLYER